MKNTLISRILTGLILGVLLSASFPALSLGAVELNLISASNLPDTVELYEDFELRIKIRSGTDPVPLIIIPGYLPTSPVEIKLTAPPSIAVTSGTGDSPTCWDTGAGERRWQCNLKELGADSEFEIVVPVQPTETSTPTTPLSVRISFQIKATGTGINDTIRTNVTVVSSSLAGRAFRDLDNDGNISTGEPGIANSPITLTGTAFEGTPISRTAVTDGNGNFNFTGLPRSNAAGYTIAPEDLTTGTNTAGTAGGDTSVAGRISGIVLGKSVEANGYLFAEIPPAPPRIGLAKTVPPLSSSDNPNLLADGTVITSFRLHVENLGLETLENITVKDPLSGAAPAFGTQGNDLPLANGEYMPPASPTGTCGGFNSNYNGATDTTLASGFSLEPGASCYIDIGVHFRPTTPLPQLLPSGGNYENRATVTATGSQSGQTVSDDSVDGSDPDPNGDSLPDESGPTPVTLTDSYHASIGMANQKQTTYYSTPTVRNRLVLRVQNFGNEPLSDIVFSNTLAGSPPALGTLAAGDPLTAGQYKIISVKRTSCSSTLAINASYDGAADPVVATLPQLLPKQRCELEMWVEFAPRSSTKYSNQASVSATGTYTGASVSDLSNNGSIVPDRNDPTPLYFARAGLAKQAAPVSVNSDGTVSVPFRFTVRNIGGDDLKDMTLTDPLAGDFPNFGTYVAGGPIGPDQYRVADPPAFIGDCDSGVANAAFNGAADTTLATIDRLNIGQSCTLETTIRFRPAGALPPGNMPYLNQAEVRSRGVNSSTANDLSDDGVQIDGNDNAWAGDDGENDPTPVSLPPIPQIALNKRVNGSPTVNADASLTVPFRVKVTNFGTDFLRHLTVDDPLAAVFGTFVPGGPSAVLAAGQYSIESAPAFNGGCAGGTLPNYDGDAASRLATISQLDKRASCEIDFSLRFKPADQLPLDGYRNQASGSANGAISPVAVSDASQDGDDPDPDGNGDPTDNDDPTPVTIPADLYTPRIGLNKFTRQQPRTTINGTVEAHFTIQAINMGNESLKDVTISDLLSPGFGNYSSAPAADLAPGTYTIEEVRNIACPAGLTINSGYDGAADTTLATIAQLDKADGSCEIGLTIRFNPGDPHGRYENSAEATAQGMLSGRDASDISQDGDDPDPDGNGDPTDNDDPTPVAFPRLGLNKYISAEGSKVNPDGTITVPFRIRATNMGNAPFSLVTIHDDLDLFGTPVPGGPSATLDPGQFTLESPPTLESGCMGTIESNYDGSAFTDLATINGLDRGDSCEIAFSMRFKPAEQTPVGGYRNQASGSASGAISPVAVNDVSQDGDDPDPDGNGDPTDNDDPTPVPANIPRVGLAKTLSGGLSAHDDGSYSGVFRLTVGNYGSESLKDVTLSDLMNSAPSNLGSFVAGGQTAALSVGQYTIDSAPTLVGHCPTASPSGAFNGQSEATLATIGELATEARCTFEYGVRFVPVPGTAHLNQATVEATGLFSGATVTDRSDDGDDPDPDGDQPTPLPVPRIGLAKMAGTIVNNGDGTYSIPFVLTLANAGDTALTAVQVSDDLSGFGNFSPATALIPGQYGIDSDPVIVNPAAGAALTAVAPGTFTGTGAGTALLNPVGSSLPTGTATAEIHFSVRFFPNDTGPFNNSAVATGDSPSGNTVRDDSVSGNIPDRDGDGNPNNDSSPTPVDLPGQVIGAAKQLGSVVQKSTGRYDIPYSLVVMNTSTASTATNVQISDDLNSAFPSATAITISGPASVSGCSGTLLQTATPPYDGTTQPNLLAGNQNLQPGEFCTLTFTARVDFGDNPLPSTILHNSATATTARTPGGDPIATDLSDDGSDPDPNGNGDPSEAGENDPTPIDLRSENLSSVRGTVWIDGNHDRIDNDGPTAGLPIFDVEVLNGAGELVASATTDDDGRYVVTDLFPSTAGDPATYYDIRFRDQDNGALYGRPLSQDPDNPNGTVADGIIAALQLVPGIQTVNQDLPLDPSGIIYDAVTRQPTAGATVTLNGPPGFDPALHLLGGTANVSQVTGSGGSYQFLLLTGAPNGDYSLAVTPPPGYLTGGSAMIPACSNTPTVTALPDPALVQSYSGPPPATAPLHDPGACPASSGGFGTDADSTRYYTAFNLTVGGSADVVNNHIPVDPVLGGAITLVKTSPLVNVSVGQLVPYTITATSSLATPLTDLTLRDTLPPGFKYKKGSASVDGVAVSPTLDGRTLSLDHLTVPANGRLTLKMLLVVGAGVQPGEYVNQARIFNDQVPPPDNAVSNRATATVRVVPDPLFDCSDVIGKVFDDRNANGYQDDGEEPIPNVRLATARGLLVTTDAEGRYHITCALVPNELHGSNFIMKLDERTLPSGYRLTTENPRTVLLTRGKMGKLNFGAAIHRVVRLEMTGAAFEPGSDRPTPAFVRVLEQLPDQLRVAPSVVRLAYNRNQEEVMQIRQRLKQVRQQLKQLWSGQGPLYDLSFEEEIFQRATTNKAGGAQ